MGINTVKYEPITIKKEKLCICPSFITDDNTDFITADQLQRYNRLSRMTLHHYLCEDLGLSKETEDMIVFDHIIHNGDRHTLNFGVLRDAESLNITGFAPLFDNGSSFGYRNDKEFTKPFTETRMEQLNLINNNYIIPDIKEVKYIIKEIYKLFEIPEEIISFVYSDLEYSYELFDKYKENGKREEVEDERDTI